MDTVEWQTMVMVQTIVTILNMLLITNVMDRGFTPIVTVILVLWMQGARYCLKEEGAPMTIKQGANFQNAIVLSSFFLLLFFILTKRVHKEVFVEYKKSNMLQTEYRTIYDQLEESIFVLKEDKITHLNIQFKKFIVRFFGVQTMKDIQKSP
jgi:hypothetical protein